MVEWQENSWFRGIASLCKDLRTETQEFTYPVILSIPRRYQLRQLTNGWTSSLKELLAFAKMDRKSYIEDSSESVTTVCRCQDG